MWAAIAMLATAVTAAPPVDRLEQGPWTDCIIEQRPVFRDANEPVDVIVTAIMSACIDREARTRELLSEALEFMRDPRERRTVIDRQMTDLRQSFREALTQYLVRHRMGQAQR